jgi:hypothetical protein
MEARDAGARRPFPRSRIPRLLLAGVGLAFAWHASPVLLWHLRFAPALAAEGPSERLFSETKLAPAAARGDWAELSVGNLRAHLPLEAEERARCAGCADRCRLALADGGIFAVFDAPLPEVWAEARDRFAPDAGDISLLRSHGANWRTIDALTERSRSSVAPPRSFRYEAPGSHGIVTAFRVADVERRVVYVYGAGDAQARVLGVVNTAPEIFDRILGSLLVDGSDPSGPSGCD